MRIDEEKFRSYLKSKGLRSKTVEIYLYLLQRVGYLGDLCDFKQLNVYLAHGLRLTPSQKDLLINAIRNYYKYLNHPELCIYLEKPRYNSNKKVFYLNEEQRDKYKQYFVTLQEKIIIMTFLETGMRRSILLSIKPQDLDDVKNTIFMSKEYPGNKNKQDALFPISKELMQLLKQYINENNIKENESIIILKNSKGRPYKKQDCAMTKLINQKGKDAGMPFITPHTLRHTVGTIVYEATGHDTKAVSAVLKQSDEYSALRYSHSKIDVKKIHDENLT